MLHKFLLILAALLIATPALAGGLSQDPEALSFLGSYEGSILVMGGQQSWDLTLSAVDDSGSVKVSKYHVGAVGNFNVAEDVPGVTGLFQRKDGQPQIALDVPGRATIILTKEEGGLSAHITNSRVNGKVHLDKK